MPKLTPSSPALVVRAASRTDIGMRRAANQDSLAIIPAPTEKPIAGEVFLMVADGMGAHAAGELASQMATDSIPHAYQKSSKDSAPEALRRAIHDANAAIYGKGSSSSEFHGMGTTCSCLVLTQGVALIGHVGDSRVYRLRDGLLEQLTFDHSLVWEMAAASKVAAEQVPTCIPKNVITRSLGPHETVNVDMEGPHPLQANDVFLLCSDGLTGVVDDTLAGVVLAALEPEDAVQTLVDLANLRGGPDNISVIVAKVVPCQSVAGDVPGCPSDGASHFGFGLAAAAACVLACGWFAAIGQVTGMLASVIGLGAAIAYAVATRQPHEPAQPQRQLGGRQGDGPYRSTEVKDHQAAAATLRELVGELASLGEPGDASDSHILENGDADSFSEQFAISWDSHREAQAEADAAFDRQEFSRAIAGYASIMRAVVKSARDDDQTHRYRTTSGIVR